MRASAKLRREDPAAPALLRAKIPVAVLGLPFVAAASAGDRRDLSFQLRTAFPAGPSLHLSYHPYRHGHPPVTLSLRSGVGLWGSPRRRSPLLLSAHLSPGAAGAALFFSIRVSYSLGDHFAFKPIVVSGRPNPNPPVPKENGGLVEGPLQWRDEPAARGEAAEEYTRGTAVIVRTTLPVARRAAVRLRWAVRLPRAAEGGGGAAAVGTGMPFLAVDKISIVTLEEEGGHGGAHQEKAAAAASTAVRERERDEEALKGMLFWMSREVEEMKREQGLIKESLEELRRASSPASARGGAAGPGGRRRPPKGV